MNNIKTIISLIAVASTIIGYIPYLRDVVKGKTTPHIYTWFIWGTVTIIAYALQVSSGAGVGSWVTLAVAIISFIIFAFGLKGGKKDISKSDTVFFLLSILAIFLWLVVKQPVLSILIVSITDMLGFIPTIRKSWHKPHSETLFTYELNAFRHGISLLALQQYNVVTWLYPASWAIANALFSTMLILRRKSLKNI